MHFHAQQYKGWTRGGGEKEDMGQRGDTGTGQSKQGQGKANRHNGEQMYTVQTFKICETGIFAKDTPQKLLFFAILFGFATKILNGGREINFFLRLFFQFAFTNKTNAPNANCHAYK